jgi:uncharacterized RDD family membrane protein YckC
VLVIYFALALYIGNGQTIGKRIMGTRVISLTHRRMTLWQSTERALGYAASLASCPGSGGIGRGSEFIALRPESIRRVERQSAPD